MSILFWKSMGTGRIVSSSPKEKWKFSKKLPFQGLLFFFENFKLKL